MKAGEIHLWLAPLGRPASQVQRFVQALSSEERTRAGHFRFERDRRRFIARRGILREILGSYLDVDPGRLPIRRGKNGKPELADTFGTETVHFNLSHSMGVALFAFARDREIGVDIEYMGDFSGMEPIAERFFSVKEKEFLRSLAGSRQREAFFHVWTRKEALIKALGDGLSRPLDRFGVLPAPDDSGSPLGIEDDPGGASRWLIRNLKPAPDFAGAVAVKTPVVEIKHWLWDMSLDSFWTRRS